MSVIIDSITGKVRSQSEIFDLISGNKGRTFRRNYIRYFRRMFPKGHRESLRDALSLFAKEEGPKNLRRRNFFSDLFRLHPRAVDLLLKYGKDYRPKVWNVKPPEPESGQCYSNSWKMIEESNLAEDESQRLVYVEGVVMGAMVRPVVHAWNSYYDESYGRNIAIDWTLFATVKWNRYFGIALTRDEYKKAAQIVFPGEDYSMLLLIKKHFPKVEDYLIEVLERRNEMQK